MIIDFHTHIFPDKIAPKAIAKLVGISGLTPQTDGTVAGTLAMREQLGLDLCVCLNIATAPSQAVTINNTAAAVNNEYEGKLIALGSVHPETPDLIAEMERLTSLGIKGIKLHPDYQEFMVDEHRIDTIYETAQRLGLFVVLHAGWDCYSPDLIHCPPARSREAAKRFPDLKFVLAHFGGLKQWDDVEQYLVGLPNVYFDTAMCATYGLSREQIVRMINKHPRENVLLGSDCPWENPKASVEYVQSLGLSDDHTEDILGNNAMRLLNL